MWRITYDFTEKKEVDVRSFRFDEGKMDRLTERFKLVDDDGIDYFEGVSSDSDSEEGFDPLDEYGAGFGCTTILYKRGDKWEEL